MTLGARTVPTRTGPSRRARALVVAATESMPVAATPQRGTLQRWHGSLQALRHAAPALTTIRHIEGLLMDDVRRAKPWPPSTQATFDFRPKSVVTCLGYLRLVLRDPWSGVLQPFAVQPTDPVDVNRAANIIAAHLDLAPLRCVVAIVHLDEHLGGTVEMLRGSREVFIEISPGAARFAPTLLAVLAHELTHKRLFDRGIDRIGTDELRYETLVDAASVYLGLGKLLLNGYEYVRSSHDRMAGTIQRIRHRFGYLTVDEVAFAHAITCRIRRHPWAGWSQGLSPFACRAVRRIEEDMTIRHHLDAAPRLMPRQTYL